MTEIPVTPNTPDIDKRPFDAVVIDSANAKIGLNPEGGYVTSWRVRNPQTGIFEDALYQGSELKRTGIPTLFPNYNNSGIKDESGEDLLNHGFGRNSLWTVEQMPGSNKVVMKLGHDAIPEKVKALYPYKFETEIEVEAAEDGGLLYSLKVRNLDDKDIPISPGLHPYFPIPQEDKTEVKTDGITGFDAASFDWDTNPPDNEYSFSGRSVIRTPQRQITVEDVTPMGRVIEKMVVWSQTPQKLDYQFICFEPITRGDNALINNPIQVAPGVEWNMNLRFSTVTNSNP